MLKFDIDDEIIEYTTEEANAIINDYMDHISVEETEHNGFVKKELNTINLLIKLCNELPFIRNLIAYYLSLPIEKRKQIVEHFEWNNITPSRIMQDFSKAIEKIEKQQKR